MGKSGIYTRRLGTLAVGMKPLPGYCLRGKLGHGAFGEVWEAETDTQTIVALKFLKCESTMKASREFRAIQNVIRLKHPNLCIVTRAWCQMEYIIVAMEKADTDLATLSKSSLAHQGQPLSPEQVCLFLDDAAAAIDFLNAPTHVLAGKFAGIQHGDIKPSNLLVFGQTVKVCDFGLAAIMDAPFKATQPIGTPAYSAPELFRGSRSLWSDQYSLAVSYCELRTGRLPFTGTPTSFLAGYTRPAPDLTMLSTLERIIIGRALDTMPQNRWPSCREMTTQLARLFV